MTATRSTDFFWSDWLGDQAVRRLTPAERGVWIDLIALAAAASPVGYVCDDRGRPLSDSEIARVTNAGSAEDVAKLIAGILEKGVASRDRSGRLFNRRMVRDAQKAAKREALSAKRAAAGRIGAAHTNLKYFGKPDLPQQVPQHLPRHLPRVNGYTPSLSTKITSSEAVAARDGPEPSPAPEQAAQPKAFEGVPASKATREQLESAYAAAKASRGTS